MPGTTRRNCFDLLRLGAAVAVLASHAFVLAGRAEPAIGSQSLGNLAVLVFFAISGFLIAQSWMLDPRLGAFLVKRALRIGPALVAVVALTALALGPLLTTLPAGDYFANRQPWSYMEHNVLLQSVYHLPGVFASNPFPDTVNGSLWTLKHEVRAYLLLALLGVVGLLARRRKATLVLAAAAAVAAVAPAATVSTLGDALLLRSFCVGTALYLWRDRVPWHPWIAVSLVAAWLAGSGTPADAYLATLAIPYTTILLAYRLPVSWARLTGRGDISYGVYLWAFPVQQILAGAWHGISPVVLGVLALPVTVALATASWVAVERPALRLKARLTRPRRAAEQDGAPAPAPAAAG